MDFFTADKASAAMDFLKGDKKDETPGTTTTTTSASEPAAKLQTKSSAELLSSAKLVAEAAQSAATGATDKLDKQKVAGAAADLLDAAKGYGKLGEDGVGKYVEQAEDYLQKYSHGSAPTATPAATPTAPTASGEGAAAEKPKVEAGGDDEKSGSDYLKMAEGFLGKH